MVLSAKACYNNLTDKLLGVKMNIYKQNGFEGRQDYLQSLADDYGVPESVVYTLASVLGPNEDFDGLVTSLEDYDDYFSDDDYVY